MESLLIWEVALLCKGITVYRSRAAQIVYFLFELKECTFKTLANTVYKV